ncbi:MAG: hypothetical protein ACP5R4_02665 [Armatimonadota bacterium]
MSIASEIVSLSVLDMAKQFVANTAFGFLVPKLVPVRMGEILEHVNKTVPVTPKVLKLVMQSDARFAPDDRRWRVATPELDSRRPVEASIVRVLQWAQIPVKVSAVGGILASTYGRTPEAMTEIVRRLVSKREEFFIQEVLTNNQKPIERQNFSLSDESVGLSEWLLDITSDREDDVQFDNFEDKSELEALEGFAKEMNWEEISCTEASLRLLDLAGRPVSSKALGWFCWLAYRDKYNPSKHFNELAMEGKAGLLSNGLWCGPSIVARFNEVLAELHETGPDVELYPEDLPKPVTVEPEDLVSVVELVISGEEPCRVPELVESQFNLTPKDPGYDQVRSAVEKGLRSDSRVMWVGWDRWQRAVSVPDEVTRLPQELIPVYLDIEGVGGQKLDQELEDEGLEADLAQQINDPLVRLGGTAEVQENGRVRCVVTYWLRQLGLLAVPGESEVFPRQPEYLLVDLVDDEGTVFRCWYNNQIELLFGLKQWYDRVKLPGSGGVFYLVPESPGRYRLAYEGEEDERVFIEPQRLKDLLELRETARMTETSTWEIVQEVMRGHSKGVPFSLLCTEVQVVRQSSARLVASILSSYHGFYERGGLWHFNERDAGKGFKKQKRKYIVKR